MSVYTKTGDGGQTDLIGGTRVSKADIRVACCGCVDELNAALGLAKSLTGSAELKTAIEGVQKDLFTLAAELAGGDPAKGLTPAHTAALERLIDQTGAGEWSGFVLPGADPASAALHLARAAARRLERELVACVEAGRSVREEVLCYVNRLSDALFALACREEEGLRTADPA